ncbi:MAG: putative thiol:disulfide interchange protein DsbC precursor [Alphaproteobacteria bacterium ADurb.Bin100]|nr:MAG: putative thiol:disulfide interchange protein DsbC precursor [Alphaproteobacteria bacterium ADurb.Bin100]
MKMNEPHIRATRGLRAHLFSPVVAGLLAAAIALPCAAQPAGSTVPLAPMEQLAPTTPDTRAATGAIGTRLQALYPSTRFGAINPTPWPGVFEVTMGANLAYVDGSGQYFLFGHLYDMKAQRDLTAERKDTFARIDFDALPLSDAMKEVRGNGARVLAIFSDPDCPYCQKLEADIRNLTNVTIYTFLMPLVSLHPAAHSKAVSVWCATDRTAAWHAMMWRGESVPQADCPHPVDRNVALGERLGINGTPTLIALDGRMLPGAASKEQIEAWLMRSAVSAQGGAKAEVMPR